MWEAQEPGGGPAGRLYVPQSARTRVLKWGHESPLTCHPRGARTLNFLQRWFGGRPSRRALRSMWRPAPCAARESLHLKDCTIPYPYAVGHGCTFPMTLSWDSHHPKATMSSWWLWTGSWRPLGSFPCPNCLRPKRQQSFSWTTSFGCLEFPWILSLTEGPSFRPGSGGPSASWLRPQPANHLGSIQSLMARRNGLTRIWRPLCGVWRPITPAPGLPKSYGQNMLTTPSSPRPLGYPPLNASLGIPPIVPWRRVTGWHSLSLAFCPTLSSDLEEG